MDSEQKKAVVGAILRILNLEDNENDAELNQAMLSARWPDCKLERVDNREDFLAALEKGGFDLILSDYSMPNFNGREALSLARERRPEVPFLFVSGTIGEDAAIEALKNGATDYVLKHRPIRLIPAVDRALRDIREREERERAEEAMRQSEHKYRQLFECLSDAALLVDMETEKIIDANSRSEELLACTRGDIIGRKQSQFLLLDKIDPKAGARTPTVIEGQMIRCDGKAVAIVAHASQLTLYGRPLILWLCHSTAR